MSAGGRSAEQQSVAAIEHLLEGQHLMQHLLGQREVLLQELRGKSGKDIKWPNPCAKPSSATPVMDENMTPNAQLSVLEFMLEQRQSPCRRERQPVELVIVINAADEEKLALEEQVASLQGELDDSLQLLAEAHHSRCGLLKSMQAALVVTSEQLARAKANEQKAMASAETAMAAAESTLSRYESTLKRDESFLSLVERHLRRHCILEFFAACISAILLLGWRVLELEADKVSLEESYLATAVSIYENCQDIAANCESVKTDLVSLDSGLTTP
eukprot:scaffold74377_cov60-Phaeocystis_antarctica.AAC.5